MADLRVVKRVAVGVGLAAVFVLATGCTATPSTVGPTTASSSTTSAPGRTPTVPPAACPSTVPTPAPTSDRPGVAVALVPPDPIHATVCRYHGLDGASPDGSLAASRVVSGADLDALVTRFDSPEWRVVPQGSSFSCPDDDGAGDLVVFVYPSGPPVSVTVGLSGCRFASNGARTVSGDALGQALGAWVGLPGA